MMVPSDLPLDSNEQDYSGDVFAFMNVVIIPFYRLW
jgi:hypothetical protein